MDSESDDYPARYRACRVCLTPAGQLCYARSSRVVDGQPAGGRYDLPGPHCTRQLSTRRRVRDASRER